MRNSANNGWITLQQLDGTMLLEDGSAGSPAIAFRDDTNTGMFSGAADELNFSTGGAERLKLKTGEVVVNDPSNDVDFRVESNSQSNMLFVDGGNNRVGISTNAPSTMFHVAGRARVGANTTADAELQVGAGASGNRNALIDLVGDTTYTDFGLRIIRNNGGPNTTSVIDHRGTGALEIKTREAGAIKLTTNGNEGQGLIAVEDFF